MPEIAAAVYAAQGRARVNSCGTWSIGITADAQGDPT
jgi:hypothetical protein